MKLKHKLAIELGENDHGIWNTNYEIKKQKVIEEKLGCEFIIIDTGKEDFDIYKTISEIFRHIINSLKRLNR